MIQYKQAVICVDDDPMILQVLGFQLEKILDMSETILELCTDPLNALICIDDVYVENIKVAFIITDYRMPQMSGATFIRKVKEKYPEIPCVLLSGQANSVQVTELKNDHLLESFIEKPWRELDLIKFITALKKYDKL
ncbi:MAG: response regulator [Crocinitomicaceae bacterium]|mgnify:CR=1 FL=1|tara:strand:- start:1859 stop:2269 length:411 start_codon:yes stop_codon:yes gene_type:complete